MTDETRLPAIEDLTKHGGCSKYFLKSERLGFRNWTEDDIQFAIELWGDPNVTRFIAPKPFDRTQVIERLRKEIANRKATGVQYWPIFQLDTDEFVGCCGLRKYKTEERIYELGFHLKPQKWGNGFATEAAATTIDFARSVMKLKELFAGHHPENSSSKKVLLKLGFVSTGTEFYEPTQRQHPSYSLRLNDD